MRHLGRTHRASVAFSHEQFSGNRLRTMLRGLVFEWRPIFTRRLSRTPSSGKLFSSLINVVDPKLLAQREVPCRSSRGHPPLSKRDPPSPHTSIQTSTIRATAGRSDGEDPEETCVCHEDPLGELYARYQGRPETLEISHHIWVLVRRRHMRTERTDFATADISSNPPC
jgi:hypothetical protein